MQATTRNFKQRIITTVLFGTALMLCATSAFAISAVRGTIKKVDSAAQTVVVKTADGAEHTFHFTKTTIFHGTEKSAAAAKDSFQGLKEGSEVVVHYSEKGTDKTATEVDHVGKDGLKVAEGTITVLDRSGKTIAIKTASGTEETFVLTGNAAEDGGADIAKGTEKSAKVTIHYTEEGGRKIAHFFGKSL